MVSARGRGGRVRHVRGAVLGSIRRIGSGGIEDGIEGGGDALAKRIFQHKRSGPWVEQLIGVLRPRNPAKMV